MPVLLEHCGTLTGLAWRYCALGGVEAARKIRESANGGFAGFDVALLDRSTLVELATEGFIDSASMVDLLISRTGIAVRCTDAPPDVSTVMALQAALQAAHRIAYSTGPSGRALLNLLEVWGLLPGLADRLVQAPVGVPVAQLIAEGHAQLGFQQLSELQGVAGIDILGPMPPGAQIDTVFTVGACRRASNPPLAMRLIAAMSASDTVLIRREHGFLVPTPD